MARRHSFNDLSYGLVVGGLTTVALVIIVAPVVVGLVPVVVGAL